MKCLKHKNEMWSLGFFRGLILCVSYIVSFFSFTEKIARVYIKHCVKDSMTLSVYRPVLQRHSARFLENGVAVQL